jgi:hypothetical protein
VSAGGRGNAHGEHAAGALRARPATPKPRGEHAQGKCRASRAGAASRSLPSSQRTTQPSAPPCELLDDAGYRPIVAFADGLQAFAVLRRSPSCLSCCLISGCHASTGRALAPRGWRRVAAAACPPGPCAGYRERQDRRPRPRLPAHDPGRKPSAGGYAGPAPDWHGLCGNCQHAIGTGSRRRHTYRLDHVKTGSMRA